MKRVWSFVLLAFLGCVPPQPTTQLSFLPLGAEVAVQLVKPFEAQLRARGIRLKPGQAYRYEGRNERAFLAAVDLLYRQHTGYCPLTDDGFLLADGTNANATLIAANPAAQPQPLAAIVYDLSSKPQFVFALYDGESIKKLEVATCSNEARIR